MRSRGHSSRRFYCFALFMFGICFGRISLFWGRGHCYRLGLLVMSVQGPKAWKTILRVVFLMYWSPLEPTSQFGNCSYDSTTGQFNSYPLLCPVLLFCNLQLLLVENIRYCWHITFLLLVIHLTCFFQEMLLMCSTKTVLMMFPSSVAPPLSAALQEWE